MIAFVTDIPVHPQREVYRAALDAIIDPVSEHAAVVRSETPVDGALNVRFFVITLGPRRDVFVGHGLADKDYSHWESVKDFPYVFCSGPLWRDRYIEQGAPPDRLRVTGFPKLDPLFQGKLTRRPDGPRILWAPTHPTSWPERYLRVRQAVADLPFTVASSLHPTESRTPTLQALADADVVISDGGSMLYEAWALGKPVVFPSWLVEGSGLIRPWTVERELYDARIGYHSRDERDFARQVGRALTHGITQAEAEFVEGILPTELRGTSGRAYAEALTEMEP